MKLPRNHSLQLPLQYMRIPDKWKVERSRKPNYTRHPYRRKPVLSIAFQSKNVLTIPETSSIPVLPITKLYSKAVLIEDQPGRIPNYLDYGMFSTTEICAIVEYRTNSISELHAHFRKLYYWMLGFFDYRYVDYRTLRLPITALCSWSKTVLYLYGNP